MPAKILQVGFKLTVPPQEWEEIAGSVVDQFASLPGLRWKIWLLDPATGEAGGVYLFEDESSLQSFLQGPIPEQIRNAPFQRELSVRTFDVMEAVTERTRGPVRAGALA